MSIVVAASNSSDISIPASIQIPTSKITIIDYDPSAFFLFVIQRLFARTVAQPGVHLLHSSYRLCLLQLQVSMAVYDLACLAGGPLVFFVTADQKTVELQIAHFSRTSQESRCLPWQCTSDCQHWPCFAWALEPLSVRSYHHFWKKAKHKL